MERKASENTTGYRTFQATAVAIPAYRRVKIDSNGLISVAGATETGIGVTMAHIPERGYGTVKLWSAPGTFLFTSSEGVSRGTKLFPVADGKVNNDVNQAETSMGFVALEDAVGADEIIEAAIVQQGGFPLNDGFNIPTGGTYGTRIGMGTDQKLSFWGVTPIVQPRGADQAVVSTTIGNAVTATATQNTGWGADTEAHFNDIVNNLNNARTDILALATLTNALRNAAVAAGAIKGSA